MTSKDGFPHFSSEASIRGTELDASLVSVPFPKGSVNDVVGELYVGPMFSDKFKIDISNRDIWEYYMEFEHLSFCFDVINWQRPKEFEDRIVGVRETVNHLRSENIFDLPLVRVSGLYELIDLQKEYIRNGYKGMIFVPAYGVPVLEGSNTICFKTLIFSDRRKKSE